MSSKDIEIVRFMANVWKLNDERNKRIEEEKRIAEAIRKRYEEDI
jgi:hypothetical protein